MATQLAFHETKFNVVKHNDQIWLTSAELASALQYSNVRAVTGLYNRYKDEFTESMSLVLKMNTKGFGGGNSEKDVRIFSLRGAHLVAMLSKTSVAKKFRRWVLDILDREVGEPIAQPGVPLISQEEKDAYSINALVTHYMVMFDAWRYQIEPALRKIESPLAGRLHDRFGDGYIFLKTVEKSLNGKLLPGQSARIR